MKRLLWVTALAPCFDAGGGGQIRQAHLLSALADHFEVSLLVGEALRDERVRARVQSVQEVPAELDADPRSPWRRRMRDIRWLLLRRSSDEVARHAGVRDTLGPCVTRTPPPDVVCVEYLGLAQILPPDHRGFWTLTLHNLPSVIAEHNSAIAPGSRQRLMLRLEERNSRRVERWAAGAYDLVVVPSAEDAARLPGAPAIVPNGVDTDKFQPSPLPAAPRVVFTGALHTLPNRDGISWFCEEVWPRIRAGAPEATLTIVGSDPPPEVAALAAQPGVSVHADVPDVAPFLENARVAVVPLRIGSGSRLKALEAMASGRPVVGTSIGIGGLQVRTGEHLLIGDQPADLAAAVLRVLADDELAGDLAVRGRALVERRYSWKRIGADYASLLAERGAA